MNELERFDFRGHEIRVLQGDDGEPRWIAVDVAKVLGYRDAANMTRMLDREDLASEKVDMGTHEVSTSQVRRVTVVNESGLYTAISHSQRPEAAAFRRWVTDEVLPAIRQHGGYLTPRGCRAGADGSGFHHPAGHGSQGRARQARGTRSCPCS